MCRTDQACSRRVDHCLIPSVSMPLLGVGFLLERHLGRREHGTPKPGTQTIQFSLEGPLDCPSTKNRLNQELRYARGWDLRRPGILNRQIDAGVQVPGHELNSKTRDVCALQDSNRSALVRGDVHRKRVACPGYFGVRRDLRLVDCRGVLTGAVDFQHRCQRLLFTRTVTLRQD